MWRHHTVTGLTSSLATPIGAFDLATGDPPDGAERPWTGTRGADVVRQYTISAGYGLTWRDRVQLRFGVHRTRYDKAVRSTSGVTSERISTTTDYNISAVVNLIDRFALFGSWVTGLEESGSAPASATNRKEVLPPVAAEQFELGARYAITSRLTLIGALFQLSKPTPGFRSDGSFGLVGKVRHRGVEASIAGQADDATRIVAGLVAFASDVTGPLVDAGMVGAHAAGISQVVANANIERRLSDSLSVDAALSHLGKRWADTANSFKAPAITTFNLGARGRFRIGRRPAELRVLASNVIGVEGYLVAPSGLLTPVSPRTVRAILTIAFGARK